MASNLPRYLHTLTAAALLTLSSPAQATPTQNTPVARLWPGKFPAETRVVCPEMGCAFTIPKGWSGSYADAAEGLYLVRDDGEVGVNCWMLGGGGFAQAKEWAAQPWHWLGQGARVTRAPAVDADGVLRAAYTGGTRRGEFVIRPGHSGSGIGFSIWGGAKEAKDFPAILETLFAGARQQAVQLPADGMYAWSWFEFLRGYRLVHYDTYSSSGGSGYSYKWQLDLRFDGAFGLESSGSSVFGNGSEATHGSAAGSWRVQAWSNTSAQVTCVRPDGRTARYNVGYNTSSGQTFLGGSRHFRVASQTCPRPVAPPAMRGLVAPAAEPVNPGGHDSGDTPIGKWVCESEGYALQLDATSYLFYVRNEEGTWDLCDRGALRRVGTTLQFTSADDGEVETHTFRRDEQSLTIDLDGTTRFVPASW